LQLEVDGVTKDFGGLRAVDNVSFSVEAGTLTAIIGPNGAGKTTLFNLISGTFPATGGSIRFVGKKLPAVSHKVANLGIARTFQNVRLFHEMSLLENVLCAWNSDPFFRASLRPGAYRRAEADRMRRACYIMEELGIDGDLYSRAGDLPFGKQRLAEIARALALSPKVLLLDEPAAGLNRTETSQLSDVIKLITGRGTTVLLVEHDMQLVMNIAERVIVLESGSLIADGPPEQVSRDESVIKAYLGSP